MTTTRYQSLQRDQVPPSLSLSSSHPGPCPHTTRDGTSHYRENRYQYVHVCDDCVFVVSVSNEEEFAEQKLCVVDQSGVDKRDPGRRGREGEREGGREGGRERGREGGSGGGREEEREGGRGGRKEGGMGAVKVW